MIDGKNKIIDTLVSEIDKTEKVYSDNIRRQEKDVDLLVTRMESQYKILRALYQEELRALEYAIFEDHADVLAGHEDQFGRSMSALNEEDEAMLENRLETRERLREGVIAAQRSEYRELRALKEQLDEEVHETRVQLQDAKARCLLTEEQLEYSSYLLKKREEEYKSARSVNKRKRNKQVHSSQDGSSGHRQDFSYCNEFWN